MKKEITLEESQKIALQILKQIANICETQGYRYCLIYGTLIGAVRHKGFIPWDDDVDIMMPRPDYERLLLYVKENATKYPNLEVFNPNTNPDYPYMITRISDNRYVIDTDNEKDCGMGVFIDIYPYDGLGNSKKEAVKYGMKGDRLSSLCFLSTRQKYQWNSLLSATKNIAKLPLFLIAKCFGKNYFQKKLQSLACVKEYDENEYVGCVIWLSWGEKDMYKREWFEEVISVPFEDGYFNIPKEYDKILSHIYGDYMTLPPEEERIGHHFYKVYEK